MGVGKQGRSGDSNIGTRFWWVCQKKHTVCERVRFYTVALPPSGVVSRGWVFFYTSWTVEAPGEG